MTTVMMMMMMMMMMNLTSDDTGIIQSTKESCLLGTVDEFHKPCVVHAQHSLLLS